MEQPFDPLPSASPPPDAEGSGCGEVTLADVLRLVEADTSLPESRKRHWASSVRRVAEGIGRPPASIPARLTSLRHPMARLNAAVMGIEEKSLSNHKSNALAAVRHVLDLTDAPRRGLPMSAQWADLLARAAVKPRRLLSNLARFCSSRGIAPAAVTEQTVEACFMWRAETTFLEVGTARVREMARAWNRCVDEVPDWPGHRLVLPGLPGRTSGPAWEAFPDGLRAGIETHLRGLATPHRSANGRRRKPCKRSTIDTRRRELMVFVRRAVASGAPLESLTSLERLLAPDNVVRTFESFLDESGDRPTVFVIDLAWKLHAIAREIGAPAGSVTQLEEIRATLEEHRPPAMTEKNMVVVRAVIMTDIWQEVIALPVRLLRDAELKLNRSPTKAASLAATAIQLLILTRAPVRIGNLMAARIGENLVEPGGPDAPLHLTYPHYDVKNRVDLEFPFSAEVSALIRRYIELFRPHLGAAHTSDWLFPGDDGKRTNKHASDSIAACLERHIGLRVTAHQFRHAAAAFILRRRPGEFEFVRRILGHRNVQTTIKYYTSLEAFHAGKQFGQLIEDRAAERSPASSAPKSKGAYRK
jgi:integrase